MQCKEDHVVTDFRFIPVLVLTKACEGMPMFRACRDARMLAASVGFPPLARSSAASQFLRNDVACCGSCTFRRLST